MAIVPPTFPPNCGQPQAITTNTATAEAASSARPRPRAGGAASRAPRRSSVLPTHATAIMPQTAYSPIASPPMP